MIILENVSKSYKGGVCAVDNISMNFIPGKVYVIMGPSGSGKSTLLNMIGGLTKVSSGKIVINDNDISRMNEKEMAKMRMKNIGFIFQGFYLNNYLNAMDNVIVPMLINKEIERKNVRKKAEELLRSVAMEHRFRHFPEQMSGGEMQRVAIARALANDPDIILADEPTGNLDEENENMVFRILRELANEGRTIIIVSHNENAINYADELIKVKKGRLEKDV